MVIAINAPPLPHTCHICLVEKQLLSRKLLQIDIPATEILLVPSPTSSNKAQRLVRF